METLIPSRYLHELPVMPDEAIYHQSDVFFTVHLAHVIIMSILCLIMYYNHNYYDLAIASNTGDISYWHVEKMVFFFKNSIELFVLVIPIFQNSDYLKFWKSFEYYHFACR